MTTTVGTKKKRIIINYVLFYFINGTDVNESLQARIADITLIEEPVQPSTMGPGAMDQLLVSIPVLKAFT